MESSSACRVFSKSPALSDYHLFRSMQHDLEDTHFRDYEEVWKLIAEWVASKPESLYRCSVHLLPERWEKVIQNDGKYFDWILNLFVIEINVFLKQKDSTFSNHLLKRRKNERFLSDS